MHTVPLSASCVPSLLVCMCPLQWWGQEFGALLPRVEFVVGDMFQPSTLPRPRPGRRTLYVLKQILHDWSDADSLTILAAIRAVISDQVGSTAGSLL